MELLAAFASSSLSDYTHGTPDGVQHSKRPNSSGPTITTRRWPTSGASLAISRARVGKRHHGNRLKLRVRQNHETYEARGRLYASSYLNHRAANGLRRDATSRTSGLGTSTRF